MILDLRKTVLVTPPRAARPDRVSDAELALAFARSVRVRLKLRISLETIARSAGVRPLDCVTAVQFAEGPDWLKFRALVEDWPWSEIQRQVRAAATRELPADQPAAIV